MSNKRKPSPKTRIRISSVELIKNATKGDYISNIRLKIEPKYYNDVISELDGYPQKLTDLLSSKERKELVDIGSPHLAPVKLDNELIWAKCILFLNFATINKFVILSNEFSKALLKGDFKKAEGSLSAIENEFGQSIWLIKNKIAFLQLAEGLESQKKYTQIIKDQLPNGSLLRFIVHWVSIRNEGKTTTNRFSNQIEPIIYKLNPKTHIGYHEYLRHHLLGKGPANPDEFSHVLEY